MKAASSAALWISFNADSISLIAAKYAHTIFLLS